MFSKKRRWLGRPLPLEVYGGRLSLYHLSFIIFHLAMLCIAHILAYVLENLSSFFCLTVWAA